MMAKITIELDEDSTGNVMGTVTGKVEEGSLMYFLVLSLEKTIPLAIEAAQKGYKEISENNIPVKPTTH